MSATTPASMASAARAAWLNRDSGIPRPTGSSHAIALTCACRTSLNRRGRPGAVPVTQPGLPASGETGPPGTGRVHADPDPGSDDAVGQAPRGEQDDRGPDDLTVLGRRGTRHALETMTLTRGQDDRAGTYTRHDKPPPVANTGGSPSIASGAHSRPRRDTHGPQPHHQRHDEPMAAIPDSTKVSLQQRLTRHAHARWPTLAGIEVRYRAGFAYVDAKLPDGDRIPLMRLRYHRSAHLWGFAIYLASHDGYQDSVLPDGNPIGTAQDALDRAGNLYLTNLQP